MTQDYDFAKYVLQDLGYTPAEASKIINEIKQGNYAFPCKKAESVGPYKDKQRDWMQNECTGIDVPVLWSLNQGKRENENIILLAQDPLRDMDYWDYSQKIYSQKEEMQHDVIVGTPYALHISEETKHTLVGKKKKAKRYNVGVYRAIIEQLCEKGYNVYCTDIFKYYMLGIPNKNVTEFDVGVFINECKRVNPAKIIAMGKKAQYAVAELQIKSNMQIKSNRIISVPHPKARPQRTTAEIVAEIISKL